MDRLDCNCNPYHRIGCPAHGEDNRPTDRCERCGATLDEPGTRCVGSCVNAPYGGGALNG
jgi:hypothetical protein